MADGEVGSRSSTSDTEWLMGVQGKSLSHPSTSVTEWLTGA